MRKSYIHLVTKELIEKYQYQPPIPVEDLAEKLGLSIREVTTDLDIDAKLDPDKKRIVINLSQENLFRRRFSIAHELGHYVLQHYIRPWDYEDPDTGQSFIEQEADEFAGALLMPKDFLAAQIKKGVSPNDLQHQCQVSKQALWVRMEIYRLTKLLKS
jgi:Zn-dependent peptidase ImmA (M78 family)